MKTQRQHADTEWKPRKTAQEIQDDITLMRQAYAERRSLNQPRRDRMLGWGFLSIIVVVPAGVAILIKMLP